MKIEIWKFANAPEYYRKLSKHGGDEDWIALVPEGLMGELLVDVFFGGSFPNTRYNPFGCSSIESHLLTSGDMIYIGAHA